jgi:replicative DNA helicase|tara:strand:+ start:1078 stop:2295 length:1218 start_codon:yes stop_codon:yes gene_type:complete
MQTSLLKSLLTSDFYTQNKGMVKTSIFDDTYSKLYKTIEDAHCSYNQDLSAADISAIWAVNNATATRAEHEIFQDALTEVDAATPVSLPVAKDVIEKLWMQETFREIAQLSLNASEGSTEIISKIYERIEQVKQGLVYEDDLGDPVTDDIHELLASASDASRWPFNIETLSRNVLGIGPSEFAVVFARPETGKSSFGVSLAAAPGGWCQQGARVLMMGNEETMKRTRLRAIQAWNGWSPKEVASRPDEAAARFSAIKDRFIMKDIQEWDFTKVDRYITRFKPDIVIIDQLDKVNIDGTYNSSHEKLREVYRRAREMAKRHECALVAVSQASADADGRTRLDFSMMENSKTGKAAEADLIIGIGKHGQTDDGEPDTMRFLNISKNKLSGYHGVVPCNLLENGRYVV